MPHILVTGANGQLGSEIRELSPLYNLPFIFTDIDTLDISDLKALEPFFKNNVISHIINCAAFTAVDLAETKKTEALLINKTAVKNLCSLAKKQDIKIIHISTDYIFDGRSNIPYREDDTANPMSVYGMSKYEGEKEILSSGVTALIIRTSWLYSSYGQNFVKTILRAGSEKKELNVVFDQTGTPTYAGDLAKAILDILALSWKDNNKFIPGLFHYANEGVCSWYDFAVEIVRMKGLSCKVNAIETKDFPTPTRRPQYSVLNKSKIRSVYTISIPYWKDSLELCLKKIQ